ncbi:hypothetical protein CP908_06990 [Klebsiella pneumoniae]|nr:hypothetical protein CP908_06990 [Klebsiella pneumoniae]
MMSLWDALRMNMMISYQELVRTFLSTARKPLSQAGQEQRRRFCAGRRLRLARPTMRAACR